MVLPRTQWRSAISALCGQRRERDPSLAGGRASLMTHFCVEASEEAMTEYGRRRFAIYQRGLARAAKRGHNWD